MESEARADRKRSIRTKRTLRTLVFICEIALICGLLAAWISSKTIRDSKSLTVLFLYCFPSELLVGLLPHEPILLYYGEHYSGLTVALVSVIGTVLAEALNYSVFRYVDDTDIMEKTRRNRIVHATIALFRRAPFTAIVVAGFTPIPFFPIRFLVVMGRYPVLKYLAGVFLSRGPRFYILAVIGKYFRIPISLILVLFVLLIVIPNIQFVRKLVPKSKPD